MTEQVENLGRVDIKILGENHGHTISQHTS